MKFAVVLASLCLFACEGSDGPIFVALQSDFSDFRSWPATALGDTMLAGHPAGERTAFLKTTLTAPADAYPIGTLIMKTVAVTPDDETTWAVFGMVKRGGDYNSGGARDWEFFLFSIPTNGGDPQITGRGSDPTNAAGVRLGYMDPGGNIMPCNSCHGSSGTEKTDFVLAPQLFPANFGTNSDGGSDGP